MSLSDDEVAALEAKYNERLAAEVQRMEEYRKVLREEFALKDPESAETAIATRKELISLVPDAQVTIGHLLNHAESESVRANLAKFVMQEAIKIGKAEGEEDEMSKLLKAFQKKEPVESE